MDVTGWVMRRRRRRRRRKVRKRRYRLVKKDENVTADEKLYSIFF